MATAYTTYTANAKIPFTYHFVCEHCGKDSGMIVSEVVGTSSINISGKGRPTVNQQTTLNEQANAAARSALQIKIKNSEKGKYGDGINSKCPHCGKIQSWELKSGRWKPLWNALQGTAAGFLIMAFASLFGKEAGNFATIFIPIGFAIGLSIGLIRRIKVKSDSAKTTVRNKPEFSWSNMDIN